MGLRHLQFDQRFDRPRRPWSAVDLQNDWTAIQDCFSPEARQVRRAGAEFVIVPDAMRFSQLMGFYRHWKARKERR